MNNIDRQYKELLEHILYFGIEKKDRTGTGTKSIFGWQIRHNMKEGFPLLTTKKMAFKTMVTELLWFLRGDTNIKFLHDNNCHIWDGDYAKSGRTDGELGPIYGKQWRNWNNIDQIQNLINELKTNPDSRRLMVSAWNVGELDQMVLPPCHYGFQVYTRELSESERFNWYGNKIGSYMHHDHIEQEMNENNVPKRAISLMYNTRSQDVPLGTPFNIASYALLLMMIAKQVNMIPDQLIANMGDCHVYLNQIEGVKEQLTRTPYELPTVKISDKQVNDISEYEISDFVLENYQCHPTIKIPLSN